MCATYRTGSYIHLRRAQLATIVSHPLTKLITKSISFRRTRNTPSSPETCTYKENQGSNPKRRDILQLYYASNPCIENARGNKPALDSLYSHSVREQRSCSNAIIMACYTMETSKIPLKGSHDLRVSFPSALNADPWVTLFLSFAQFLLSFACWCFLIC